MSSLFFLLLPQTWWHLYAMEGLTVADNVGTNTLIGVITALAGVIGTMAKLVWDSFNKKHAAIEARMCENTAALQYSNLMNLAANYSQMVKTQVHLASDKNLSQESIDQIKGNVADYTVMLGLLVEEAKRANKILEDQRNAKLTA